MGTVLVIAFPALLLLLQRFYPLQVGAKKESH
ncbi:hypothetical protein N008_00165 [Hymenobacter sp. APR13]|nr:hypothetical protein N008_00165 [Hymenobacter sp. APR13]